MVEPVASKASANIELSRKVQADTAAMPASDQQASIDTANVGVKAVSPRMRADPIAGVLITEYLSSDGQVERQFPSEAAVAYLRSGLMENGSHKPDQILLQQDETLI